MIKGFVPLIAKRIVWCKKEKLTPRGNEFWSCEVFFVNQFLQNYIVNSNAWMTEGFASFLP